VDLDEHIGVEDNLERSCSVCGATLTVREIEASRESDTGAFLCTIHAAEEAPILDDVAPAE
jgi:hypothetical protein